jgi:RNA polymerase sigma-70 factor, ECF subfamily
MAQYPQQSPPPGAPSLGDSLTEDFETAAVSHLSSLLGLATRLTRNPAEAEDLVQDTYVKAMRARGAFAAGTNLRAWLMRILTNTFINRFRRGGLERSVLDGPDADPLADGWISSASMQAMRDPESLALRPMLEGEIQNALNALPEEFRVVVLLVDVEEMTYREVADSLGCPIGTVMSRLHRGRRMLRSQLVEHARMLGIATTDDELSAHASETKRPADLDSYRSKKAGAR